MEKKAKLMASLASIAAASMATEQWPSRKSKPIPKAKRTKAKAKVKRKERNKTAKRARRANRKGK